MSSLYPLAPLGQLCDVTIGRQRSPKNHSGDYMVPYLRAANVKDGRLDLSSILEMNFAPSEQLVYGLRVDDVLVTEGCGSPAELGASARWQDDLPGAVCFQNTLLRLRARPGESDPGYLYHLARWCQSSGAWLTASSGTSILHIGHSRAHKVPVPRPPLSVQRRIGAILSGYDDLIENNNRRIKILEEMAQRIYREWFVQFRYPGHEDVPLVNSELGRVPEGWQVVPLSMVVQHHIGGGWGANEPSQSKPERARVIRGADIPRLRQLDVSACPVRHHSESNLKSRLLGRGDIVVEVSGGSKGQPVGRALLVTGEMLDEMGMPTICASFCKLVRCDREMLSPEILIHRLMDAYGSGELGEYQVQSTGITNLRFAQLLSTFAVTVPPSPIQAKFDQIVAPGISLAASLGRTVRNLRDTRDLLLPRLVSGEIDVADLNIEVLELVA